MGATIALADFLGPTYPAPRNLVDNGSLVTAAWTNVSSTIATHLHDPNTASGGLPSLKNLTISMGIFSTHDPAAAGHLQYHHASAEVAGSSVGLNKVDGDSIYRIASISKLIATLAGMLELHSID